MIKYVKDFMFPSNAGFSGSAGQQMVKGYARGGQPKGQAKVGKVMGEFGKGQLHSGSKSGPVVKNPKQAVAIALSEARKAGAKIPVRKAEGGIVTQDKPKSAYPKPETADAKKKREQSAQDVMERAAKHADELAKGPGYKKGGEVKKYAYGGKAVPIVPNRMALIKAREAAAEAPREARNAAVRKAKAEELLPANKAAREKTLARREAAGMGEIRIPTAVLSDQAVRQMGGVVPFVDARPPAGYTGSYQYPHGVNEKTYVQTKMKKGGAVKKADGGKVNPAVMPGRSGSSNRPANTGLARAAEMSGRTMPVTGRPAMKKGGKVVEKGTGEVYASKAAMKRHEARESAAEEAAEHGKARGGRILPIQDRKIRPPRMNRFAARPPAQYMPEPVAMPLPYEPEPELITYTPQERMKRISGGYVPGTPYQNESAPYQNEQDLTVTTDMGLEATMRRLALESALKNQKLDLLRNEYPGTFPKPDPIVRISPIEEPGYYDPYPVKPPMSLPDGDLWRDNPDLPPLDGGRQPTQEIMMPEPESYPQASYDPFSSYYAKGGRVGKNGKAMGGRMETRDVVSRETKASPRSMMQRGSSEKMRRYEGQRPNVVPMVMKKGGYAEGGKASDLAQDKRMVKAAVHKHEKAMHPGKPMTKLRKGGMAC